MKIFTCITTNSRRGFAIEETLRYQVTLTYIDYWKSNQRLQDKEARSNKPSRKATSQVILSINEYISLSAIFKNRQIIPSEFSAISLFLLTSLLLSYCFTPFSLDSYDSYGSYRTIETETCFHFKRPRDYEEDVPRRSVGEHRSQRSFNWRHVWTISSKEFRIEEMTISLALFETIRRKFQFIVYTTSRPRWNWYYQDTFFRRLCNSLFEKLT